MSRYRAAETDSIIDDDDDDYQYSDSFVSDEEPKTRSAGRPTRKVAAAKKGNMRGKAGKGRGGKNSRNTSDQTPRTDPVVQRVLSARKLKINELRNQLEELKVHQQDLLEENKLLKKTQRRQEKALNRFEDTESDLPQIMQKHSTEVRSMREQLRKTKEKYDRTDRYLRDAEDELERIKSKLKKYQKLADENNLLERDELSKKCQKVEIELEEKDVRIKELEKHVANLNKNHRHEIGIEMARNRDTKKKLEELKHNNDVLEEKLKEKNKELEMKNIYANRMKQSHSVPVSYGGTPRDSPPAVRRKRRPSLHEMTPREKAKEFERKRREDLRFQKERRKFGTAPRYPSGMSYKNSGVDSDEEYYESKQSSRSEVRYRSLEKLSENQESYSELQDKARKDREAREEKLRQEQEEADQQRRWEAEERERKDEEERRERQREQERKDLENRERERRRREEDERREAEEWKMKMEREKLKREAEDRKREAEERERKERERRDRERMEQERRAQEEKDRHMAAQQDEERKKKDLLLAKLRDIDSGNVSNEIPEKDNKAHGNFFITKSDSDAGSVSSSKRSYSFSRPIENLHNGMPSHEDNRVPYIEKQKKQKEKAEEFGYQPSFGVSRTANKPNTKKQAGGILFNEEFSKPPPGKNRGAKKKDLMSELFGNQTTTKSKDNDDDIFSSDKTIGSQKTTTRTSGFPWDDDSKSTTTKTNTQKRDNSSSALFGGGNALFDDDVTVNDSSKLLPRRQRQTSTFSSRPAVTAVDNFDNEEIEEVIL